MSLNNRYIRDVFLSAILVLNSFILTGQEQVQVSGRVTDIESGESLIGVNVIVKGKPMGTVTDSRGLTVKLADNTDNRVYGVVTDRATFLGSLTGVDKSFLKELTDEEIEREFNAKKIAMVGHVQVRVKDPIQIGQSLTLSEEIGVARVALTFEEKALSFGIARESYDSTDVGIIEARLF